ncbi:hypothetical protein FEZ63_20205 [Microvirga brassicacearum]|uniref:Anti-bacteriophage protein A/HamA C-terminal domain-containing protein n=2 Tax=Microvirga brassicacearum TaxID=2580413 RepID=A0A5N3P5R6_9HYPH|nr:hypothetical protein FEZ63_20205 [Microvirga brassicacearum]
MTKPTHVTWLNDTGQTAKTADGSVVSIWEFSYKQDDAAMSAWAKHFREHYCRDAELPDLVSGTGKTNAEFLLEMKFPDKAPGLGPATRSGDFGEILVADYLEYILDYWCPREHRYEGRKNPNVSDPGTDIVGFKFSGKVEPTDELFTMEAKAGLRPSKENRLQTAIDDSGKDLLRDAATLSAIKQRLLLKDKGEALTVQRFQDPVDRPFTRVSGASAVLDVNVLDKMDIDKSDASKHPNKNNLKLVLIKGTSMMDLVHALYDRAANEA